MQIKKILSIIGLIILNLNIVFAHAIEGGSTSLITAEHISAFILTLIVIVIAYKTLSKVKNKEPPMYFLVAVISLGLIHLSEFLFEVITIVELPENSLMHIEHILTYVALILIAVGLTKLKKQ